MNNPALSQAVQTLKKGGIVAYPTEAVYGLGCDPLNANAVERLNVLKNRPDNKGFILIGASWKQLQSYAAPIPADRLAAVLATWPGPYTWIFPAAEHLPAHLKYPGPIPSVALRWTAHSLAQALCAAWEAPLISTSANRSGNPPLKTAEAVRQEFSRENIFVLEGDVGNLENPTSIRDARTGEIIR